MVATDVKRWLVSTITHRTSSLFKHWLLTDRYQLSPQHLHSNDDQKWKLRVSDMSVLRQVCWITRWDNEIKFENIKETICWEGYCQTVTQSQVHELWPRNLYSEWQILSFLQRAQCSHWKRCISYGNSVRLSVRLSDTCRYCVKTTARSTV